MHHDFEAVIGLEVHCQLATDSKIFCSCRARLPAGLSVADVEPNSNTCPVCAGHPGTLPVLNEKVVELALRAALATECRINRESVFARKNYFYPDLPKGYQISQFDLPIGELGALEIEWSDGVGANASIHKKRVAITRIHIEEDAGKNVHGLGQSFVNLNRAGVPLIEIVSAPELNHSIEAGAYLRALHAIVTTLGVCDGNMQEGNFRCDANVSVRKKGDGRLGTRTEIKNVNSFRFVEKAIDFEIDRQIQVILSGGKVVQETRSYDAARGMTFSLRSKEEAEDYRYFPEPDLLPVRIREEQVETVRQSLPELPHQKKARFVSGLGLTYDSAGVLTSSLALTALFEEALRDAPSVASEVSSYAQTIANWIVGEISRLANEDGIEVGESKLNARHLVDLYRSVHSKEISSSAAKQLIGMAWKTGDSVEGLVARAGLRQVSDSGALEPMVERIILAFPKQVEEIRGGKEKVLGFLVGQLMKETAGKANPTVLQELLKKRILREKGEQ
jgi:aspartyl-tRNA(Asn)/glutamyl-tRNA(Gln) amidotransferase subunit B